GRQGRLLEELTRAPGFLDPEADPSSGRLDHVHNLRQSDGAGNAPRGPKRRIVDAGVEILPSAVEASGARHFGLALFPGIDSTWFDPSSSPRLRARSPSTHRRKQSRRGPAALPPRPAPHRCPTPPGRRLVTASS